MSFLFTEISVSLFIAFLLGCILTWLWRGHQMRKRVDQAENDALQRGRLDIANLRTELEESHQSVGALQADNTLLKAQLNTSPKPTITSDTESKPSAPQQLAELEARYAALRSRWERERTQFAQLVINKNKRIAELEQQGPSEDQAVIEDGTAEHSVYDDRNYSRQQLEAMLVDMRAQVAEQESELAELRSKQQPDPSASPAIARLSGIDSGAMLSGMVDRDLASQPDGSRLIEVERERANLLHRISELNGLRASDAEHTAALQKDLDSLRDEAQSQAQETDELRAQCARLNDDIASMQSLLDATTAERDQALAVDAAPTLAPAVPLAALGGLRGDTGTLQSDLSTVQSELQTTRRELESRDQQLRWAHSELDELRPLQHQLTNLRSSLSELIARDENGEHDAQTSDELESLRTRLAKLQADSKINLERKEQYYQNLLREKSALIARLQRESEAES